MKEPFRVGGGSLYDLLGLVFELVHPISFSEEHILQGNDRLEEVTSRSFMQARGGLIGNDVDGDLFWSVGVTSRNDIEIDLTSSETGFRLVRTLGPRGVEGIPDSKKAGGIK